MEYRAFGSTGLQVSALGFGSWPMSGDRYGPIEDSEAIKAIHRALEMPEDERIRRARGLTRAVLTSSPVRWLTAQLRDLDRARAPEVPDGSEPGEHVEQPFGTVDAEVGHSDELGGSF